VGEIFVGCLGFVLGVIAGAIGLALYALRSVVRVRRAAEEGIRKGLNDVQQRRVQAERDNMIKSSAVTKITTYRCDMCDKTFTTVGPILADPRCLHCGGSAEPATRAKRKAVREARSADSFGDEVKN
jgi:hypothetical protein